MSPAHPAPPGADELRAAFDAPAPLTIGVEEEVMLLDPETLDLAPRATEVMALVGDEARFKLELPAAQLEILTPPLRSAPEAVRHLAVSRARLLEATRGTVRAAGAGMHPFAAAEGELNPGERYARTADDYAIVARRQLVFGLQVHVAVGGADRTLAVYNALRSHLPELAALAANAPFHAGRDTGLASMRPVVSGMLPRQGVPPAISSWEAFADELRWGAAVGAVPEPRRWWWELRPHPVHGTLELRVPDAQASLADAGAVVAFAHALVAWLAGRHDAGEPLPAAPSWRIAENRWSACRHGLEGELADVVTGERAPARERLHARLEELAPVAERLGCAAELAHARAMVDAGGGAAWQREVAREHGLTGLVDALARRFSPGDAFADAPLG